MKYKVGDIVVGTGKDKNIPNGKVYTILKIFYGKKFPYKLSDCNYLSDETEIRPLTKLDRALS